MAAEFKFSPREPRDLERRHRCEVCGEVFICELCSAAMVAEYRRSNTGRSVGFPTLYDKKHDQKEARWLCPACLGKEGR